MRHWLILAVATLAVGCDRTEPSSTPEGFVIGPGVGEMPDDPFEPGLRVSDDPAELAAVRKQSAEAEVLEAPSVELYLREPWRHDVLEHLAADVAATESAAVAALDSEDPRQVAAAAALLVQIGSDRASDGLRRVVADPAAVTPFLEGLRFNFVAKTPAATRLRDLGELKSAVGSLLVDQDPRARLAAARFAASMRWPEAEAALEAAARDAEPREAAMAIIDLAALNPPVALSFLRGRLAGNADENANYWLVVALGNVAQESPELASEVAALAEKTLLAGMSQTTDVGATPDHSLLSLVAEHGGTGRVDTLRAVAERHPAPWVRGSALEMLAKDLRAAALPMLVAAIQDQQMRPSACSAIGTAFEGTGNADATRLLRETAAASPDQPTLDAIADASLRVGGDEAQALAQSLAGSVSADARQRLLWRLDGLTIDEAARRLRERRLIGEFDLQTQRQRLAEENGIAVDDVELGVAELFAAAGLLTAFDAETGEIPVRHDRLLREFAAASGGVVGIEAAAETMERSHDEDWEAPYTVRFIHRGRLYTFTARNLGDWYDVEAVVYALNAALADAGTPQRYLALSNDGQWASYVFAEPEALRAAAAELHLTLPDDPNEAIRAGKAFEKQVIEQMRTE